MPRIRRGMCQEEDLFVSYFCRIKLCPKCETWRSIGEYHRDVTAYDGTSGFCKICRNAESKRRHHDSAKLPLSCFDLTDLEQVKKACHYTNLQPLWAEDNLKKGACYDSR